MRTTLDKEMVFPIVFSLSIEWVNYAVFSYLPNFSGNTVEYRPYNHFVTEEGACFTVVRRLFTELSGPLTAVSGLLTEISHARAYILPNVFLCVPCVLSVQSVMDT
jgi:hypothetical protein